MDQIDIALDGGTAEAYVARPDRGAGGEGEHPGVLFFIDAIGLRPRIADWGYVVLAPNVLWRSGTAEEIAPHADLTVPGEREKFFAQAMPRVQALTAELAERDLPVYLSTLRSLPGVASGPVGTTGYCMGARLAIRAANLDPGVAAVAGFHGGGLVTDTPDSPHRGIASSRAAYVFGHADQDRSMPAEAIEALGSTLAAAGLSAKNEVYAGAAHGYSMADTSMYDESATERSFAELEALFARTLQG